jgi:hypothetical protein
MIKYFLQSLALRWRKEAAKAVDESGDMTDICAGTVVAKIRQNFSNFIIILLL